MTDHTRYIGPAVDPADEPDPDAYTWFTTMGMVLPTEQWRTTAAGTWNDLADYDPARPGQLLPGTWVQVRRSPHPQPDAELYIRTRAGAPDDPDPYPVTFAELHALIDTEVGSGIPVNRRLSLARAVWRLLTPE